MSQNKLPKLMPWERGERRSRDLARLLEAAWRHRARLAAWYPWVPVTPARVSSPFHGAYGPYPAGALVLLWNRSSFFRGTCPQCGAEALGFGLSGALSQGHIHGICLGCARWLSRSFGTIGRCLDAARPALAGSCFSVSGGPRISSTAPVGLVAVLEELGETGLPDPFGPDLWPEHRRNDDAEA
jgi:hypothetical protein